MPFLRSENGLVFTSRDYTRLVRSYGLQQEFIPPHCPQQNGIVERASFEHWRNSVCTGIALKARCTPCG